MTANRIRLLVLSFLLFCFARLAPQSSGEENSGPALLEDSRLTKVFGDAGLEGTFAVLDSRKMQILVHNPERAGVRFPPASTFKIANALIGLHYGSVADLDEVLPYGGKDEFLDIWEHDMNLRDAMKISNVPIFHELARRTGLKRMREMVRAFDYGNEDIGDSIEHRFWLREPLAISALEQVEFLRRLTAGELPVKAKAVAQTRELILQNATPDYRLYAKSGWTGSEEPHIGWWVGWVERDGLSYPFALNIKTLSDADVKQREPLARACLKALGLLD